MTKLLEWISRRAQKLDAVLFPAVAEYKTRNLGLKAAPFVALGVLLFSAIGLLLPADGVVGFDWVHVFSQGARLPFYPPWTQYVHLLTWPGLVGLTLMGVGLALVQRGASPLAIVLSFLSLPVMWTLFLGQLDGLALLGCVGLPWLAPLALVKPQISTFAFLARKRYLLACAVTLAVSCLIWGLWPLDMLSYRSYYAEGRYRQDISLWPWSIPVALALLWLSRGDEDMLMLAGSFVTPHLIPYHYVVLVPALGRLGAGTAILAWALSWTPFLANWLGHSAWFLGHLFPAAMWIALYRRRCSEGGLRAREHPLSSSVDRDV